MTETLLRTAAEEFVDRLNSLVAATIKTDTRFVVALGRNGQRANIRAIDYPDSRSDGFPLVRDDDDPEAPALLLLARFEPSRKRGEVVLDHCEAGRGRSVAA